MTTQTKHIDLTSDDEDDEQADCQKPTKYVYNGKGKAIAIDLTESTDDESASHPTFNLRKQTKPTAASRSSPAVSKSSNPLFSTRGNPHAFSMTNGPSPGGASGARASLAKRVTPPKMPNNYTAILSSSQPKVSPPRPLESDIEARLRASQPPSIKTDDDSFLLKERPGNVQSPSLHGSPKGKRRISDSTTPLGAARRTYRRSVSGKNPSKSFETTPSMESLEGKSPPETNPSQPENEEDPSTVESEEESVELFLRNNEDQHTSISPPRRPSRSRRAKSTSQRSIPGSLGSSPIKRPLAVSKGKDQESLNPRQTLTISNLEESLRSLEQAMKDDNALAVRNLLHEAKETEVARVQLFVDEVSPFASLNSVQLQQSEPAPKGAYTEVLDSYALKGNSSNKLAKSQSVLVAKSIKSAISRVPKYSSTTFVRRNILAADEEKLKFVPYLGDVDNKESHRRRLEKDLAEAYTAERSESSRASERISNLRDYIDFWLGELDIGCSKQTMEHFTLAQGEDIDEVGLGKKARQILLASFGPPLTKETSQAAAKFSRAFETVFGISVGKILLPADRLKEMIQAAKKPGRKSIDNPTKSVASYIETFATLQCLICGAVDCQTHGYYEWPNAPNSNESDDDRGTPDYQYEKKQISLQADDMIRRCREHLDNSHNEVDVYSMKVRTEPCGKLCYQSVDVCSDYRFSQEDVNDLRSILFGRRGRKFRSCDISVRMRLPCWQVNLEIEKLEREDEPGTPGEPQVARMKNRPDWYDNKRKTLKHGFEDMTNAHLHQERSQINPCSHPGRACDARCPCVKANILCERMCDCQNDCPRKFTGCSCSSYGRPCSSDSCICIQMNRECGPQCSTCGAIERLDPVNKFNDALFTTGCQNISLSRGVPKSLIMGESQLEGTGFGLYAAETIRKGEFVSEYGGEIISSVEADRRGIIYDRKFLSFLFDLNGDWAIDAARLGNKTRFINHADNEKDGLNCEAKIMFINGEHRIKFLALRDISDGEELLFNYGKKFAEKHGLSKKLPKIKEGALPKIKEGAKKGVVRDDALDALDGLDSDKRTNIRDNMRGHNDQGGGRGRGKARKSAPTRKVVEPEPEPSAEGEDEEMPDIVDEDDDSEEDEYEEEEDDTPILRRGPKRHKSVPKRYQR